MRADDVNKLCLTQKMGLTKVRLEEVYNEAVKADGKSVINFTKGVSVKLASVKNCFVVFDITDFLIKIKF